MGWICLLGLYPPVTQRLITATFTESHSSVFSRSWHANDKMVNENNNAFFFQSFITGFANHVTRELMILTISYPSYWGFPGVSDCKESAFNSENLGLILGSGRLSLGRAEEPGMATVHGVSKSWTQLNDSNTSILLGTFLASLLFNRLLLSPTMLQILDLTLEIVGGRKAPHSSHYEQKKGEEGEEANIYCLMKKWGTEGRPCLSGRLHKEREYLFGAKGEGYLNFYQMFKNLSDIEMSSFLFFFFLIWTKRQKKREGNRQLLFFFPFNILWPSHTACRISVPKPGLKPSPQQWTES